MANPVTAAVKALLTITTPRNFKSFSEWKAFYETLQSDHGPAETALLGGAASDCVGYAFAAGYQAALMALTDSTCHGTLSALCVTEADGNHPKNIKTDLTPSGPGQCLLNGAKTFITGGPQADCLLVAARTGTQSDGRPALKLANVSSKAEGVTVTPMPTLPFVPEIEHASVSFVNVSILDVDILEGDGYADYVKPFRTLEDIHVTLALCGYLFRVCRSLPDAQAQLTSWLSLATSHLQLASLPARDPATHVLLAGYREQLERLLPSLEPLWQSGDPESFHHWQRDKALLKVAEKARTQRTTTALNQLNLP